jgi:hypothetical protein
MMNNISYHQSEQQQWLNPLRFFFQQHFVKQQPQKLEPGLYLQKHTDTSKASKSTAVAPTIV